MTGDSAQEPKQNAAAVRREERQARLAKALRENLKKRKDQARARADQAAASPEERGKDA